MKEKVKSGSLLLKKWLQEGIQQESVPHTGNARSGGDPIDEIHSFIEVLCQDSGLCLSNISLS